MVFLCHGFHYLLSLAADSLHKEGAREAGFLASSHHSLPHPTLKQDRLLNKEIIKERGGMSPFACRTQFSSTVICTGGRQKESEGVEKQGEREKESNGYN